MAAVARQPKPIELVKNLIVIDQSDLFFISKFRRKPWTSEAEGCFKYRIKNFLRTPRKVVQYTDLSKKRSYILIKIFANSI